MGFLSISLVFILLFFNPSNCLSTLVNFNQNWSQFVKCCLLLINFGHFQSRFLKDHHQHGHWSSIFVTVHQHWSSSIKIGHNSSLLVIIIINIGHFQGCEKSINQGNDSSFLVTIHRRWSPSNQYWSLPITVSGCLLILFFVDRYCLIFQTTSNFCDFFQFM